jgi:acetyl esterase/lipase
MAMMSAKRAGASGASKRGVKTGSRLRATARGSLVTLALLSGALACTPLGRAAGRAAFLLPALISGDEPTALVTLGVPISYRSDVIFSADGPVYLDIYAPTSVTPPVPGAREGLVAIPGVGDNRTVPQLINLMQSLARSGVVAVEMTTNTLIAYDLVQATVDAAVQATLYTLRLPSVGPGQVGIVGFSAGGSLACLASTDPRIRNSLAFVTSFGGYFNATDLLTDIGRRALTANGHDTPWPVAGVPIQTLANIIGDTLPGSDATLLREGFTSDGISLTPTQVAQLSPQGQAGYHLLAGAQPDRVTANLAALPPALIASLTRLSPSSSVAAMPAPIYLSHDRSDLFVPYTESRDFNAALTRANRPHSDAEFSISLSSARTSAVPSRRSVTREAGGVGPSRLYSSRLRGRVT